MVGCGVGGGDRGCGEVKFVVGQESPQRPPEFGCIGVDVGFCECDDVWGVGLEDVL